MTKNIIILTGKGKTRLFTGEEKYYKELSLNLVNNGANAYILPIHSNESEWTAYYWDNNKAKWLSTPCPIPNAVYNRYARTTKHNNSNITNYLNWLERESIPYFNRSFFQKEDIFKLIKEHKQLKYYFPMTRRLEKYSDLKKFIQRFPNIFIKDSEGSQGKGIWKIEKHHFDYTLHTQQKTFKQLRDKQLQHIITSIINDRQLLMQQAISSVKQQDNPYDFRVLMLYYNNCWTLVGIGVRVAANDRYTTHVPQGGRIASLTEVPLSPSPTKVTAIGDMLGKTLQDHYRNVKEFSFDVVMDNSNQIWIVDVNSKPMSFDEPAIQNKRIQLISHILISL
ncbi:YheC/YheD family protein [Evansella cellulosilytica]|uniref:ATP-grasp domain-containing protein n=1 Tax=Evansella cellulosilytica (strain ATCC 21833 / DSM 2522 / FERM P-1141 / JCM 9156 / N-4) TaxID=649639 RepID=E6TUF3_EVAC2|nr:YheC/YheD family protein [Evansella cellulosilytica]ADU29709.1 hypothetical protein Bcell_1446 [Evansella cellulosilytica DSM 2522]